MNFLKSARTDIGNTKKTNQDSVLIREASTDYGQVLLAVVCDGMGGLSKGEVASATVIRYVSQWFDNEFADILYQKQSDNELKNSLEKFAYRMSDKIRQYSSRYRCSMGTTFVILLIFNNRYFIMNIGDSRVYQLTDAFRLLTKDQTYVQREIDMGRMTPEQAETDPQRSVLLQCVGAGSYLEPDVFTGKVKKGDAFLMCSDGFRHVITPDEFWTYLKPEFLTDETVMTKYLDYFIDLNKYRNETDNISAVLIKAC